MKDEGGRMNSTAPPGQLNRSMALLLSNVNRRLLGILLGFSLLTTLSIAVRGQSQTRRVRFGTRGYVVLPSDCKAYRTNDPRDAWSGYILFPDNKTIVVWSAGTVQTPFDNGDDKFVWVKRETLGKTPLKYGLLHANDKDIVAAALPGLNLFIVPKSDNDIDTFLKVARSFKLGKCNDCARPLPAAPSNNSLDRSGGGVLRIKPGAAKVE